MGAVAESVRRAVFSKSPDAAALSGLAFADKPGRSHPQGAKAAPSEASGLTADRPTDPQLLGRQALAQPSPPIYRANLDYPGQAVGRRS
jgi:hypothetical protein